MVNYRPSILVSDLLSQSDSHQSPMMPTLLSSTEEDIQGSTSAFALEEGQGAHFAAHERLFSTDDETRESIKQKPRSDPAVARRMIAHALGHRVKPSNQMECLKVGEDCRDQNDVMVIEEDGKTNSSLKTCQKMNVHSGPCANSYGEQRVKKTDGGSSQTEKVVLQKPADKTCLEVGSSGAGRNEVNLYKDNFKENHIGAAKRIFAHALGLHPRRGMPSKCGGTKKTSE